MSRTITWAVFAGSASSPMGLQHYELQVLRALRGAQSSEWSFIVRSVASLRAEVTADVRLPMGLLAQAPQAGARAAGRWAYRGAQLVHRFDLRLPPSGVPEVVTVHDLPPLRFNDEGHMAPWSVRTARDAQLIICPSAFAAEEATSLLGVEAVVVVPNGVSDVFRNASPYPREKLASLGIHGPFALHVGGASERKNLRGLAAAWREVAPSLPQASLVSIGPPDSRRDRAFAGCPRVIKLGYRSSEVVTQVMASALMLVVPSLYEGFGLPALEAMAAGCPVVATRAGALPEVCGDAGVLAEPRVESLAAAIVSVGRDREMRTDLVRRGRSHAAGFTWSRTAEGHLRAYAEAFG